MPEKNYLPVENVLNVENQKSSEKSELFLSLSPWLISVWACDQLWILIISQTFCNNHWSKSWNNDPKIFSFWRVVQTIIAATTQLNQTISVNLTKTQVTPSLFPYLNHFNAWLCLSSNFFISFLHKYHLNPRLFILNHWYINFRPFPTAFDPILNLTGKK